MVALEDLERAAQVGGGLLIFAGDLVAKAEVILSLRPGDFIEAAQNGDCLVVGADAGLEIADAPINKAEVGQRAAKIELVADAPPFRNRLLGQLEGIGIVADPVGRHGRIRDGFGHAGGVANGGAPGACLFEAINRIAVLAGAVKENSPGDPGASDGGRVSQFFPGAEGQQGVVHGRTGLAEGRHVLRVYPGGKRPVMGADFATSGYVSWRNRERGRAR